MNDASQDALAYDNTQAPLETETYTLERLIELGCSAALMECRVAMPGQVVALNVDGSVNVQPGIMTRFIGRDPQTLPVLMHVPVGHTQGGDYRVQMPTAVGDTGYCLVMDRCIDAWLAGDGRPQGASDTRTHNLSDAIFVPMMTPVAARKTDAGTDMVLQNGALTLRLKKTGQLVVHNGTQELVGVMDALLQANVALLEVLKALQILTALGPAPVLASSVVALQQIEGQLNGIRSNLDTFLTT